MPSKPVTLLDAKGGRDRFALLSPQLLELLRGYWRAERPEPPSLFPAPRSGKTLRHFPTQPRTSTRSPTH